MLSFEGGDASFGAGAPLDEFDDVVAGLDRATRCVGGAFARDGDGAVGEFVECGVNRCFAVAATGSDGVGVLAGEGDGAGDRGSEAGDVGEVPASRS